MQLLDPRTVADSVVLTEAASVIAAGGLVVFPTDTVYGVLCDPKRHDAVAKIYMTKGRPREKPLILLFPAVDALIDVTRIAGRLAETAARRFLPGALTLVVPRPAGIAEELSAGRSSIGVRVPDYALLRKLLTVTGPLASTSANLSGNAAFTGDGALLLPGVDLFVDGGQTAARRESAIVDFTGDEPIILREGELTKATFATWLGNLDVV